MACNFQAILIQRFLMRSASNVADAARLHHTRANSRYFRPQVEIFYAAAERSCVFLLCVAPVCDVYIASMQFVSPPPPPHHPLCEVQTGVAISHALNDLSPGGSSFCFLTQSQSVHTEDLVKTWLRNKQVDMTASGWRDEWGGGTISDI